MICIGYHLPDISVVDLRFDKSLDFTNAVFMGLTNFSDTTFIGVNFNRAEFTQALISVELNLLKTLVSVQFNF